jgi:hypothetical protein
MMHAACCCWAQELWPSLIEKAYARLHGGYAAIATGSVGDAIVDLTGGIINKISLSDEAHMQEAATGKSPVAAQTLSPAAGLPNDSTLQQNSL